MLADVSDNLIDRFQVRLAPPGSRHDAKLTVVDAAPRRLKNIVGQIAVRRQQIAAGYWTIRETQVGGLIVAWQ